MTRLARLFFERRRGKYSPDSSIYDRVSEIGFGVAFIHALKGPGFPSRRSFRVIIFIFIATDNLIR